MKNSTNFTLSTTFSKRLDDILLDFPTARKNKSLEYLNVPAVFDIEASSFYNSDNEKRATMYAWVFGINGKCVCGRSWGEFLELITTLIETYNLNLKKRLIIYIHNLSYEFQWFRKYFQWYKVFSLEQRKPIYAITKDGIEFRCSYLLSGYNLETLGENLTKYKVEKKVGDLDYNLIRHSLTHLSDKEWGYILNDGLVVMAHIQEEIERLGDITKIPLTKTGYVRNLCREKCLKGDNRFDYVKRIKSLTLSEQTYTQLKQGFMGGFTHANINYVNKVLHNVHSYDFTSSYPAVMLSEKFPMSAPILTQIKSQEDFLFYLKTYCCLFDVKFHNIRSITSFENYISVSRCRNIEHFVVNNGRVIEATELTLTVTEQDFNIISCMYEWDSMEIGNFHRFYKDYLPKEIITTILELYKNKTELKGVAGKEVEYLVSKGMINSVYGMCVTDICKNEATYDTQWGEIKADVKALIDKYNNDRQRFLFYAWGVWVTAYSRRNLFTGILEFKNDYIYSDTDSLKVFNAYKHLDYIKRYNKRITEKIETCLKYYDLPLNSARPKTIKGKEKPLGVWDDEGVYDRFKTLGAKRYMTERNGEIEITIAGVSKKSGLDYLKYKYKTNDKIFEAFREDLYFPPHYDDDGKDKNGSGKLCHTYIDELCEGEIIDYTGNKWKYREESAVHLENTEYSLSLDFMFKQLLNGVKDDTMI